MNSSNGTMEFAQEAEQSCVFPITVYLSNGQQVHTNGLSKRELFAAMVLQGFGAQPEEQGFDLTPDGDRARLECIQNKAKAAVEWADALLKELAT